ncbi:hypothetical protein [Streptomyces sp. NRRL S-340]|uniref:hypothetical protein n=1 Tax=Streptomyces sp. NRRL S-340 TaxID=1463901 RepID=UPI000562A12B|nr:hypothetical protein [Streptomyces sp. NRRL S-340]
MGTWSNWNELEGPIISAPSAASRVPENMAVVGRGAKNEIRFRSWDETGGWGDWEDLGGSSTYDPALVAIRSTSYALYAVGGKQITYRKDFTEGSGWGGWTKTVENLEAWGGLAAAPPNDAGNNSYSPIDLFTLGATNNVLQATYPGSRSWGPYASIVPRCRPDGRRVLGHRPARPGRPRRLLHQALPPRPEREHLGELA